MQEQTVKAKKGEVEFRKKLVQQQVEGKLSLVDEMDKEKIEKKLKERIEKTFKQLSLLKEQGILLFPYLEIGAERGQRSLVMENDFGASGAALDVSFHMLKSCDYYKDIFKKPKLPLRICADANHLPMKSDSIPFLFCYETIHHFPDPFPVIKEIYRVLSPGGCFFFDEEPYKKILHFDLYQGKKRYALESRKSSKLKRILDYFFSKSSCNETEHGIVENDDISIKTWKKALSLFEEKNIWLESLNRIRTELYGKKKDIKFILASLLGGLISGICFKSGTKREGPVDIRELLICPSCYERQNEFKIYQENGLYSCIECGRRYPIVEGVLFLLNDSSFKELYPEIFRVISNKE